MPTPAEGSPGPNGRPGVGAAAKQVADHAKALVGLEVELASLEVKQKLGSLGLGIGLLVGAALAGLYALGFGLATVAAALATFLPTWLALLVVTLFLLLVASLLAAIGVSRVQRGTPPVPEQAIEEAKRTSEVLRGDGGT
jgi:hypothetical protein